MKIANPPVFILIFSKVANIPCAPSWIIKTIGIDKKKYVIDAEEVNVTPGISTVNSANSEGSTKYLDILSNKNQKAKPIIKKPATTLTSAKTRIPLFVLPSNFVRTDWTL